MELARKIRNATAAGLVALVAGSMAGCGMAMSGTAQYQRDPRLAYMQAALGPQVTAWEIEQARERAEKQNIDSLRQSINENNSNEQNTLVQNGPVNSGLPICVVNKFETTYNFVQDGKNGLRFDVVYTIINTRPGDSYSGTVFFKNSKGEFIKTGEVGGYSSPDHELASGGKVYTASSATETFSDTIFIPYDKFRENSGLRADLMIFEKVPDGRVFKFIEKPYKETFNINDNK